MEWLAAAEFLYNNKKHAAMGRTYNDLKLELRLHLSKDLRKYKGYIEVVKRKDTGMYLRYIYVTRVSS